MQCALPLLVSALALAFPHTYVGGRFGIKATVVRVDRTKANVTLHAGFVRVAAGGALLNSKGELTLEPPLRSFLNTRGVTILEVSPSDDFINIRARVRLLAETPVVLQKVRALPSI